MQLGRLVEREDVWSLPLRSLFDIAQERFHKYRLSVRNSARIDQSVKLQSRNVRLRCLLLALSDNQVQEMLCASQDS